MTELQNGKLVKHVSLGVGKIVCLEPDAVHVFFPDSDKRFAAKLRLPAARPMLQTEGFEPDAWLEGLSAFSLDAASGRYALAATWLTHEQAVAQFVAIYPKGFADPAYLGAAKGRDARPARWRAAHDLFAKKLATADAVKLLADDPAALVTRLREVEKVVAPLHPPADVGFLVEAFSDEEATGPFLEALVELLSVPSPGRARFEKLFVAARALPIEPGHQWLVSTLFPFVAAPDRHMLLRPRGTCVAAERLGSDLRYDPTPNWATYSALRTLATRLLERLGPLGATDFVDVEAFLHVTATARRAASEAKPKGGAREARPRAAGRSR